ncbi:MAG: 30S ribosomal protein S8 [Candidatus Paceibacterota bacterium]
MVTDPIADFLVRMQNASRAGKETVEVSFSQLKENIAKLLVREGYLENVSIKGEGVTKALVMTLKYSPDKTPRLHEVRRVSKLSRRMYVPYREVKPFKFGKGLRVLSTPKGVVTGTDARKEKVGGEVLFTIW